MNAYRENKRLIISIHALREEGDFVPASPIKFFPNFYPRPPRGGRQSINAPPLSANGFLSTPSARRATRTSLVGGISFCDFYPRPPRGGRRF